MIEVFGWVAATVGVASCVPQLIRILRERTSAGVSVPLWQITAGCTAAWGVHGFMVGAPQMQWPNVLLALLALITVAFAQLDRRERVLPKLIMPTAVALALVASNVWFGPLVFGLLVAMPQLYAQFSQFRLIVDAPDLSGVSPVYLVVNLVLQVMWFIFGTITVDWALIACTSLMMLVCSINLGTYLVRRARHRLVAVA